MLGRGPFDVAAEIDLMRRHRIDVVVSKNSGGAATYAKIEAARALTLPVALLTPPAAPAGVRTVPDVAAALAWLRAP